MIIRSSAKIGGKGANSQFLGKIDRFNVFFGGKIDFI